MTEETATRTEEKAPAAQDVPSFSQDVLPSSNGQKSAPSPETELPDVEPESDAHGLVADPNSLLPTADRPGEREALELQQQSTGTPVVGKPDAPVQDGPTVQAEMGHAPRLSLAGGVDGASDPSGMNMPADADMSATVDADCQNATRKETEESLKKHDSVMFRSHPCLLWITNPKVWWRHPVLRLFVAVLILVLDMYLFGEDPVNDSHLECNLPGVGNIMALFLRRTSSAASVFVRVLLILLSLIFGVLLGWKIHHRVLRDCLRLTMFGATSHEEVSSEVLPLPSGNEGILMPIGPCIAAFLYISCHVHNVIITDPEEQLSSATGFEMRVFGKLCQCCSVTADLVAILLILDAILQDKEVYPGWIRCFKDIWRDGFGGWVRVIAVWLIALVSVICFAWGILNTGKEAGDWRWDERGLGGLTEVARAVIVSLIMFCDVFTVAQDWAFPTFVQPLDVKIAGTFSAELNCTCVSSIIQRLPSPPECCKRWIPDSSIFELRVTGPWLTYGPLLVVIGLDLFCMRTQLFYDPQTYGQYVDPGSKRIWTILDEAYLLQAYDHGVLKHPAMVTYAARRNTTTGEPLYNTTAATDIELNSRHLGSAVKYVTALPGLVSLLAFFVIVWIGNHQRLSASWVDTVNESVDEVIKAVWSYKSHQSSHSPSHNNGSAAQRDAPNAADKSKSPASGDEAATAVSRIIPVRPRGDTDVKPANQKGTTKVHPSDE